MKKSTMLLAVLVLLLATIVITSCTNDKAPTTTAPVGTTAAPGTSGDTTTTTTPDGTTVPPATTPVVTTTNPPVVTTTKPPVVTTTNPPVTTTEPIWNVIDEDPDSPAVIGEDGSIFSSVAYTALHKELADSIEGYYTLDIHGNDDNRNGLVIGYTNTDGLEEYYFVWLNFDALIINKNGSDVVWNTGPFGWNPNHFPRDSRVTISASVSYTEDGKLKIRAYVNGTYTVEWIDDAPLTGTGFGLKAEQPGVKAYSTSYTPEIPAVSIGNWGYWFDDLPEGTYIPSEYNSLKVVGTASKLAGQYKVTVKGTKHSACHNSGLVFGLTDLESDGLFWETGSNYYFTWISNDGKMNLARVGVDGQIWNHVAASGKIYDYRHGDSLDLVVNVYEDGKIQIYANGILYIDWTDDAPFTGTGYGVRAEVEGTVFTNLSYSETITEVKSDVTVETLEGCNYIKYTSADGSVKYMTKEPWAGPMALGNVTSTSVIYELTLTNAILADNMINFYIAGDNAAGEGTDVWSGNAYAIGFHANGLLAITKLVGTGWDGQEVIWNGYYKLPSYTVDDDIKLKIEHKTEDGKAYIKVWIQGPYDADYILAAEVVDDNPHTGTGYGLKMPMSGSIAADIKVTEAK